MFNWLSRFKKAEYTPDYSALKAVPSRGIPPELAQKEESQSFSIRREALHYALLNSDQRPLIDGPLFTEIVDGDGGFVTLNLPDNGARCVPAFSTPFRAADYVRTLLNRSPRLKYLSSSPLQFVQMLRDLEGAGLEWMTLDRCPRCSILNIIGGSSIKAPDDAVAIWAITKSTELARAELYHAHALESARGGHLELARDVSLEAVGHVTMEDPRLHLLLGQVAIGLGDKRLLREAKAFLDFFSMESWRRKLDQVEESGAPDFADIGDG